MKIKQMRRLAALGFSAMVLLLSACAAAGGERGDRSGALTWGTAGSYGRYEKFLQLLQEECPDIELEFLSYTGGNSTGYGWMQMQADDIPDIFITTQILDEELAKERLADLSGYSFINNFPTSVLDQVSIDGGVYLLPTSYTMYGIFYNKTLMEEKGWELPSDFAELEELCAAIRAEGLIPGIVGTQLTGDPFSAVLNLAKTGWLTTPEGMVWEQDFLSGNAQAAGYWEETMDYVQRYLDLGMFEADPEDRSDPTLILDYLDGRKAVFCTAVQPVNITKLPESGDELGMMPFISEDGGKNIYMYSPASYFGVSKRLTEPGNEQKLEQAIRLLSLLFSPKGQAALIDEDTPCVLSALGDTVVPEDALIYDAQQALRQGRAFPMTYAGWEDILADMGQAFKDWFRGKEGMDGPRCIARMDELQRHSLEHSQELYFCESTADFTLEETGKLLGKALGSLVGADAVMVPLGGFHEGTELRAGVTGKLYAGKISTGTVSALSPAYDGGYALMEMTGGQAKALAQEGFDAAGDGNPFPYLLVTRGDAPLKDEETYLVAFFMEGYTKEVAEAYSARFCTGSFKLFLRIWLEEQQTVSPDGNPWE